MSFWKIMGGIAAGIGTVVALPVAGAIGGITLAGATTGGTLGGVIAVMASTNEKEKVREENKSAYKKGRSDEKVEAEIKVKELANSLKGKAKLIKENKNYFEILLAMFTIGVSIKNCNEEIAPKKREEIFDFVADISHLLTPLGLQDCILKMYNTFPTYNSAMEYMKNVDHSSIELFSQIIDLVSHGEQKIDLTDLLNRGIIL